MMTTTLGALYVPGYLELLHNPKKRNLALTLQAMVNLEILQYTAGHDAPRQQDILKEVIRLGGKISPKSVSQINKNIRRLIKLEHVVYRTNVAEKRGRGRGGPISPWMTRYVSPQVGVCLRS